jgi:flagellar biosynthesis protein FlhG
MSKLHQDQAAGLRRIMAAPAPRIISILSAAPSHDTSRLMTNLAASMSRQGSKTLVVHASKESSETFYGINQLPTLVDAALQKTLLAKAIYASTHGFSIAKLAPKSQLESILTPQLNQPLGAIFNQLAHEHDIVLVDTMLNKNNQLPIESLNDGEILIQLTRQPESIKEAYTLIKKLYSQLGRRSFGIIVDDAKDKQAEVVFNNIASVAKRYMQLELEFFGAIPNDEYAHRASQLGRSVVDAFPLAIASSAFNKMALKLEDKKSNPSHIKQAAFI